VAEPFAGIRVEGLRKRYAAARRPWTRSRGVDMNVARARWWASSGHRAPARARCSSASAPVIEPTAGRMSFGGEVLYDEGWKLRDLRTLRRDRIGFIFQAPYLIPFLDVTDNVALLPMLAGLPMPRRGAARSSCSRRSTWRTGRGPCRRSSRAASSSAWRSRRALVNRPPVILADEPTAPLDSERALAVIGILERMASQYRTAIIVVTHDEKIIPTFRASTRSATAGPTKTLQ